MKSSLAFTLGALLTCAATAVSAQSTDLLSPPKILQLQVEVLKPGRAGAIHERTEAAFIQAQIANKTSISDLGMTSLTGPSRALFLSGYPSFAAYAKEGEMIAANPTLGAAFDKAFLNDGDLLTAYETNLYSLRPDLSLDGPKKLTATRFLELNRFRVKPGHAAEFEQIAAIYKDGFQKAMPGAEFIVYESQYGKDSGGVFLVIVPYTSLSESDAILDGMPRMAEAEGKATMAKLDSLMASAVETVDSNLFQLSPTMSFLPASWATADSFWKRKAPVAKKSAPKTP